MTFCGCSNLLDIIIPSSVTSIGGEAFRYCYSLSTLTFNGTVAQWNAVEKSEPLISGDMGDDLPLVKVVCSDGSVSL